MLNLISMGLETLDPLYDFLFCQMWTVPQLWL